MRIWLVNSGEPLPTDGGKERLHRTGLIAEALHKRGHEVVYWSGTFAHHRKSQRAGTDCTLGVAPGYSIKLLKGRLYLRNISFQRLINHRQIAGRFRELAPLEPPPDIIHCAFPTIRLALEAVRYSAARGIPCVMDARDMWPDIFEEVLPPALRWLGRLACLPMRLSAKAVFRGATAVSGMTDPFRDWGLALAGRPPGKWDRSFPFGYVKPRLGPEEREKALAFWRAKGLPVKGGAFIACFLGTIGTQFDFSPLLEAVRRLSEGPAPVWLVMAGDGPRLEELRRATAGSSRILWPGWIRTPEILTLMELSSVGVAPYKATDAFIKSLPNKPVEYLAGGLPVICSIPGVLSELLAAGGCGLTVPPGDAGGWEEAFRALILDPGRRDTMAASAISLYEARFRSEKVYGELCDWLEELALHGRTLVPR